MITNFFSPTTGCLRLLYYGLGLILATAAHAADKPVTLKGTISLGSGRFGLETTDGKLIGFMGKGGNKVFATCRNGDQCEITGVVVYNTRIPLFITVSKVKKLGHAAPAKPVANVPEVSAGAKEDEQAKQSKDSKAKAETKTGGNAEKQTLPSQDNTATNSNTKAGSKSGDKAHTQSAPGQDTTTTNDDKKPEPNPAGPSETQNSAPGDGEQSVEPPLLPDQPAEPASGTPTP